MVKALFLILALGLATYGAYTFLSPPTPGEVHPAEAQGTPTATPPTLTPTPTPTPTPEPTPVPTPLARLAPTGVYYVVKAFSVTTENGIHGFRVGKQVNMVKLEGGKMFVTDGEIVGSRSPDHFTNDLDIVDRIQAQATLATQSVPPPSATSAVPPPLVQPTPSAAKLATDRIKGELADLRVQLAQYEARCSLAQAELVEKGYDLNGDRIPTRKIRINPGYRPTHRTTGKLTSELSPDARNIKALNRAIIELRGKIKIAETRLR